MGTMYMAFFVAALVITGLATITYALFAFSQYRAAQIAQQEQRRGSRRGHGARAYQARQTAPILKFIYTMSEYLAHQVGQLNHLRARGGQSATLSAEALIISPKAKRTFEVANPALAPTIETQAMGRLSSVLMYLAAFCLLMTLLFRAIITQHAPWVNLYEASIALATFVVMAYLVFEVRYKTRALGLFAAGISLFFLLFAVWVGAAFNQAEPVAFHKITPALQDNPILFIHVSMMIVSYAFFVLAFACGMLMLIQRAGATPRFAWLPSFEAADELGYKAVTIGFPLLALGIILGAWWANYAWGHYWSWDPKETAALVTWLVYAIYLHARGLRNMRGSLMGWLLIAGFVATLFTYFGVSFIIPGLHSYGGVK